MRVIAMDCDGTVDISNGPIPLQLVVDLAKTDIVFVIGNRILADRTGLLWDQHPTKSDALKRWKENHPEASEFLVVDDNPMQYPWGWSDWKWYFPDEFLKLLNREGG
jgi:hypothetical protein